MTRVALTGGIGSGKSSVSSLLRARGAVVIDADQLAREVLAPGTPGLAEVAEEFGPEAIAPDGSLDRAALAAIVFADPARRKALESITHPRIAALSAELMEAAPAGSVVVYDMPLLVEQGPGARQGWDAIVVVDAPDDVRVSRLVARGMSAEDAGARMTAQASREERLAAADFVVDNSGTRRDLEDQVDRLWAQLRAAVPSDGT